MVVDQGHHNETRTEIGEDLRAEDPHAPASTHAKTAPRVDSTSTMRRDIATAHSAVEPLIVPHDVGDTSSHQDGALRISWAARQMPVLRQIRDRFEAERPL